MSFTSENVLTFVQNNPAEMAGILNCMHTLGSGVNAFSQLCSANNVRPLRRVKGQYCRTKRPLTAFNLFTKVNKDHKSLKGLKDISSRSKTMGAMWKSLSKKEHAKYVQMAEDAKNAAAGDAPVKAVEVEVDLEKVVPVEEEVPVKKEKTKVPKKTKVAKTKVAKTKVSKKAKEPEVPVEVDVADDVSEVDLSSDSD